MGRFSFSLNSGRVKASFKAPSPLRFAGAVQKGPRAAHAPDLSVKSHRADWAART